MSEKKIRASILGKDINLLKNVAKRVVKDRPADVKYFTEVKEFLVDAASDRPDVVAISVNYPHPSASKFPKIFSMVLNLPVIMFGEDQDVKTRKDLSAANADYKIPGVLTAHNFWMKLVNFQKMQEKEVELREKEMSDLTNSDSEGNDRESSNSTEKKALAQKVFAQLLANGDDEASDSSLIDSLFSQMGEDDLNGDSKRSDNLNIIKSSSTTGTKSSSSLLHWEEEDSVASIKSDKKTKNFTMIKGENNPDHVNTSDSDEMNSSNVIIQHKDSNVMSINPQEDISMSESSLENKKNKSSVNLQELEEDLKESQEENRRAKLKSVSKSSATNNLSGNASALNSSDEENPFGEVTRKEEDENVNPNMAKNDFFSEDAPQASIEEMLSGLDDDMTPESEDENQEDLDNENEQKLQNQDLVKKPKTDSKGRVQLTDKKELQKREFEKQKEKQKKDNEKTQNILEECCDEAVKKVFIAKTLTSPRSFESQKVFVYTIEVDSFKGFILVNNSFNQDFEEFMLENLRSVIIENLKSKGYSGDLSVAYAIEIPESQYIEVVKNCCEFTVSNEEETGKQLFVSFLKREVISPQYEDSDKDGMIVVDMKTIPPQTPVNFDAFIYMPINKKFVRYLKEGRSLSLKQVKRHIEGDEACELYLPKSDKAKLIQFFIQNTISWEFISYNEEHKKPA